MSDISVLIGKASFRKATNDLSDKEIQKIANNAAAILEEREAKAAEEARNAEKRNAVITEVYEMLANTGMDKDEIEETLANLAKPTKKAGKRSSVAPKYKITDEAGNEHTWTGRGKTPKIFQEFKDKNNGSLDAVKI